MALSWNEIRKRAISFSQEFSDATRENAETQSFYNAFFDVFGISRRRVASFEEPVKKLGDKRGRIDLFWKGLLLIEQKSGGRDLEAAYTQALDYFPNLKEEELPKYILVSDFQRFELYDLETKHVNKFTLAELHKNVELFGFIAGYQKREFKDQDPVNIEASERMGKLHDMLKDAGYVGHDLELLLVRLLFCLFAEDTSIFERTAFQFYLEEKTKPDGSDLGLHLAMLFQTLNTPPEKRQKSLDEALAAFPYINGSLFADTLPIPAFDSEMRESLISACYFDWSRISPAIFGSLFQSVMDKNKRRGIGAHYTTEKNIMKILKPLFLDDLHAEFTKIKRDKKKLQEFHKKLAALTFFDPACGCGNFLILAYRELRELEIQVLKALYGDDQKVLDVSQLSRIDVDAFYGIEIEEFSAKIAEVALWLVDHQMNMRLSEAFGVYFARLPLKKSAHIHHDNALGLDWHEVIAPERLNYILGNPPFVGSKYQTAEQRKEMSRVFHGVKGAGVLDYVTAWYFKAAQFIHGTRIVCAFVSTNSITQGEQVGILWGELLRKYAVKIHFAHRTFAWGSEARGRAAVHCVIVGFAAHDTAHKLLYDYDTPKSEPHEAIARNINPYLVDADDLTLNTRTKPICNVPVVGIGNKPIDGGYYLFTPEEKVEFIIKEPLSAAYFRRWIGADEFLNGWERWCLWLGECPPNILRQMPHAAKLVDAVRKYRLGELPNKKGAPWKKPPAASTQKIAATPTRFHVENIPNGPFMVMPEVSSERRDYIPFGFMQPDTLCSNLVKIMPNASIYHFGVITSHMHMAWVRGVGGRLESRYRYSNELVYNNFPWPDPTPAQKKSIEEKAQSVLDARAQFPDASLADLYDPITMPPVLFKAHHALDKAIDAAYRKAAFTSERERVEYLFTLYQQLTAPLVAASGKKKKTGQRKAQG